MPHRSLCGSVSALLWAANTADTYVLLSCLNSICGGNTEVTVQDKSQKKKKGPCSFVMIVTSTPTYILTYLLTYLLTPRSRVLLEKLTVSQLFNKFPAFYRTRSFITTFTSAPNCPYSEPAQSSPYHHIPLPKDPS